MGERSIEGYLAAMDRIPGWFQRDDVRLFQWLNAAQRRDGVAGDLLEIGVYRGRSAILLGLFVGEGERLIVCDPFDVPVASAGNAAENVKNYQGLTVEMFTQTYGTFHSGFPLIFACSSTELPARMEMRPRCRFIHVDGSHLHEIVRQDIQTAKRLLVDGGVIVFDDYRAFHTPGVAAAIWEELARGDLAPLCVTENKLYAQWCKESPRRFESLKAWGGLQARQRTHVELLFGREALRIEPTPEDRPAPQESGGGGEMARRDRRRTGRSPGRMKRLYWWFRGVAARRRRGAPSPLT